MLQLNNQILGLVTIVPASIEAHLPESLTISATCTEVTACCFGIPGTVRLTLFVMRYRHSSSRGIPPVLLGFPLVLVTTTLDFLESRRLDQTSSRFIPERAGKTLRSLLSINS